jgi:hypothetical protein
MEYTEVMMKDPHSLLLGIDIPEEFRVEVIAEGFAIYRGTEQLATVKTIRGLRIALEYFSTGGK